MQVEIDNISFEIQLFPFKLEGNAEYTLLDTGCLLESLKRIHTFFSILEKKKLKGLLMGLASSFAEKIRGNNCEKLVQYTKQEITFKGLSGITII